MNYLYELKTLYKSKMNEMRTETNRLRVLDLQAELEELNELIGVVSKLPRYSDKK